MKQITPHPSVFIPSEFTDPISGMALVSEAMRMLHPTQLDIIHKLGWFKMFVPKQYGGLELTLPEAVRIEECLSWADGSTGWVVTLCSGAGWFAGFLQPDMLKEVFAEALVCFAGSGATTGTADMVDDGFEVNGRWKYASGSIHATLFTANCVIKKEGEVLRGEDGAPLVKSFLFKKNEVAIITNWKGMGMIATGSHEFEVNKLRLPKNRCFIIDAKEALLKQPLYQYPFLQLAETTLAANLSGMAIRFIDLCEPLFADRVKRKQYSETQSYIMQKKLSEARDNMDKCRQTFYNMLDLSWDLCAGKKVIPVNVLDEVSSSSHALVRASRLSVDELYPLCGLIAANAETELNRLWRNFHTAGQHDLFARQDISD